ncbi:hypothetical protein EST38_g6578 [Candolleomyces aberdarensis]|uniref:Uncharacterized protein n=1 Tax=Candolleomyces aberdarensis TaxID=2316362 RepID=A0A4Q2DKM9_9AGAR|nr:hypothetical protein EST38_g6578 [Candolleomyces aberdarensis]
MGIKPDDSDSDPTEQNDALSTIINGIDDIFNDPAWNVDDNLAAYYDAVLQGIIPVPDSFLT